MVICSEYTVSPYIYPDPAPNGWNDYEVIPDTVGQFTGLLDKNGKEIYEGDVVVLRRGVKNISNTQTIEWCSHASAFVRVIDDMDAHFISEVDMNLYQVLGNIHDNPELMNNH